MADARDYVGKRGESVVSACLLDFCGRTLPYFDPHPLGEKCPIFDYLVELVTTQKSPPYFLASVKSTTKGANSKTRNLKVALTAKEVQAMVRCPVPAYLLGVDEPGGKVYVLSIHGNIKGGISSMPTTWPLNAVTLADLWAEVSTYWQTLDHRLKTSKFVR